jgi:hypothetical protein
LHAARQRLVSTQASHAESELKVSSGDHIDREALELLMLNKLRAVRELIMGVSSRYGYRVVACEEKEILSTLLSASDTILSNLSGSAADTYMEGRNATQDPIRQV